MGRPVAAKEAGGAGGAGGRRGSQPPRAGRGGLGAPGLPAGQLPSVASVPPPPPPARGHAAWSAAQPRGVDAPFKLGREAETWTPSEAREGVEKLRTARKEVK